MNYSTVYSTIYCTFYYYFFAQIPVPESVTRRWGHSVTSFTVFVNCVWLLTTGEATTTEGESVTSPNTVMIVELGKKNTSQLHITVYSQFSSSSTTLTYYNG